MTTQLYRQAVKLEVYATCDPDMGHAPGKDWAWGIRSSAYPNPRIMERGMPQKHAELTAQYMAYFLGATYAADNALGKE